MAEIKNPSDTANDPSYPLEKDKESSPSKAKTEYGGPKGPEPTRYGDWEKNGRCIDF